MVDSKLLGWGVGFGVIGLLFVGGAYLAFTDAFETFEDTGWDSAGSCENLVDLAWCWIPVPSGDLGCFSCLFGIFLLILVVGSFFYGSIFGVVGATLNVSDTEELGYVLPPPDPPEKVGVVSDEFAELESELESLDG
jgi:hypothetical protein